MTIKNNYIERCRKRLIQDAMVEICNVRDSNDFRLRVFCALAKLGLQLDAK